MTRYFEDEMANAFFEDLVEEEKNKKALRKFMKTGKMLDDNGNEIKLGDSISFDLPDRIRRTEPKRMESDKVFINKVEFNK